jgi:hypothetical protein
MSDASKWIKIRNWEKWQTYRRDRGQPPWIKVHREVMRNPEWVALTDAQRGQLVAMWLLAADRDGVIPASRTLIRKLCFMDSDPPLEVFAEHGFIEMDGVVASSWRHVDHTEAEAEAEEETEFMVHERTDCEWPVKPRKRDGQYEYPEPFERAWSEYPSRDGSNPKTGAYKAFRARVKSGDDPDQMIEAAKHYRKHCDRKEQTGTSFVQQAATFYGPSEPWREFVEPGASNGAIPESEGSQHWAHSL